MNKKQEPIFLLSSGRTGSTLISKILNKHKDICIISDLIEPVGDNQFLENNIKLTQKKFFELISRQTSLCRIYFWRKKKTKELLHLPVRDKDVSCLNCYTIPFTFKNNVNKIFKLLKKKFSNEVTLKKKSNHLIDFFEFFKKKTNKKIYVERTGGALHHVNKMIKFYPNAKFILNLRDPIETSISMRNYPFFRMYEQMKKNKNLKKWNFTQKKNYETYGKMLNGWYKIFFYNKKKIKKNNFFYYSYEDLVSKPKKTLTSLILFILNKKKPNEYLVNFVNKQIKMIRINSIKFNNLNKYEKVKLKKVLKPTFQNINKLINKD